MGVLQEELYVSFLFLDSEQGHFIRYEVGEKKRETREKEAPRLPCSASSESLLHAAHSMAPCHAYQRLVGQTEVTEKIPGGGDFETEGRGAGGDPEEEAAGTRCVLLDWQELSSQTLGEQDQQDLSEA